MKKRFATLTLMLFTIAFLTLSAITMFADSAMAAVSGEVTLTSHDIVDYHYADSSLSLKWRTTSGKASYCNITIKVLSSSFSPNLDQGITYPHSTINTILSTTKVTGSSGSKSISSTTLSPYAGYWIKVYIDGYDSSGNKTDEAGGAFIYLEKPESYIEVYPDEIEAAADGETCKIEVESNDDWTVSNQAGNWVSVSDKSGSGDDTFKLVISENDTGIERWGTVFVTTDGGERASIVITQPPMPLIDGQVKVTSHDLAEYHSVSDDLTLKWKTTSGRASYCKITIKVLSDNAIDLDAPITYPHATKATILSTTKVTGSTGSKTISASSLVPYTGSWIKVYIDGYDSSGNLCDEPGGCYIYLEEDEALAPYLDMSKAELDQITYHPGDTITITGIRYQNAVNIHFSGNLQSVGTKDVTVSFSDSLKKLSAVELKIPSTEAQYGNYYISVYAENEDGVKTTINTTTLTYTLAKKGQVSVTSHDLTDSHVVTDALTLKWKTSSGRASYCRITAKVLADGAVDLDQPISYPHATTNLICSGVKVTGATGSKTFNTSVLSQYPGKWIKVSIEGYDVNGEECDEIGGCYIYLAKEAAHVHSIVKDAAVAATCTTAGKTEGSHCSSCGETIVAQTTIPAKGHTNVKDAAVAATCTTTGKTEGSHCSVCGTIIKAQTTIAAKGHTAVKDAAVAATCTTAGKTEGSHCSVCGTVIKAQTTVAAKGHTTVKDAAVAATCTKAGKTEGSHCSVCGTVIKAQTTIAATGHDSGKWVVVTEATATKDGLKELRCTKCGYVLKSESIPKNHTHTVVKDAAVAATCTKAGKTEGSHCSTCGEIIKAQTTIAAKGHTTVKDAVVAATCTKAGKTEGSHCSTCGTVITAQTTIPATGHDSGKWVVVTEATATQNGLKELRCTKCSYVLKSESIPKVESGNDDIPDPVVQTVNAKKGDEVTLNVYVASKEANLVRLILEYDSALFELVTSSCTFGDMSQSGNGIYVVYDSKNVVNGKIGTATFRIKETVSDGTYKIVAKVDSAHTIDRVPVGSKAAVDQVKIASRTPGDVDGNGIVDILDLLTLLNYFTGFDVRINVSNSSVDGNDVVDILDLLTLLNYFTGFNVKLI